MGYFFSIVVIIFLIYLRYKINAAEQRIYTLERKIRILENDLSPGYHEEVKQGDVKDVRQAENIIRNDEAIEAKQSLSDKVSKQKTTVIHNDKKENVPLTPRVWSQWEKRIMENWTGILGSIILVMGIGFLSILVVVAISPFFRFVMIVLSAGGFYLLYLKFVNSSKWRNFSLWMRSVSGVVLLIGCLGAGGFDAIKWIENPSLALFVLVLGVAFNLYISFYAKIEWVASFHTIMSLLALSIIPQGYVVTVVAGVVVLFSIYLSWNIKWEYHLALTMASAIGFHFHYYYSLHNNFILNIWNSERIAGFIMLLPASIFAVVIHYRKIYQTIKMELLSLLSHLFYWVILGAGVVLYATGGQYRSFVLLGTSILVFLLARKARSLAIQWLYITDTVIAQILFLSGLYCLSDWRISYPYLIIVLITELALFAYLHVRENMLELANFGVVLYLLSSFFGSLYMIAYEKTEILKLLLFLFLFVVGVVFHVFLPRNNKMYFWDRLQEYPVTELNGFLPAWYIFLFSQSAREADWAVWAMAIMAIFLLYLAVRRQLFSLWPSAMAAVSFLWVLKWADAFFHYGDRIYILKTTIAFIPIFLLSLKWSRLPGVSNRILWPGIYLFTLHMILTAYHMTHSISQMIPGVLFLIVSPIYKEISFLLDAKWPERREGRPGFHLSIAGLFLFAVFFQQYFFVIMQAEVIYGFVRLRIVIELIALAIIIYWMLSDKSDVNPLSKYYSLFLELAVVFSFVIIALEFDSVYYPIVWSIGSLFLLLLGNAVQSISRIKLYSVFLFLVTAFYIMFVSSNFPVPSEKFFDQSRVVAIFALVLMIAYLILFNKSSVLKELSFPKYLHSVADFAAILSKKKNLWVYYPFFGAIAFFLFWSFDKSFLTLLWVLEAAFIFVLAIFLHESQFRHIAMAVIIFCVGRLILFDLAGSDVLVKAIVFLGVGGLLLFMNLIYNKYGMASKSE